MKKKLIFLSFVAFFMALPVVSQRVTPMAYYTNEKGEELETQGSITDGQAPLKVIFRSNPEDMGDYTPSYEWHFSRKSLNGSDSPVELFVRYEEDTEYTFTESGSYTIVQKTRLEQDGIELDSTIITVAISDSKLEFPNAFSPNGDDKNNIYKAKEGWRNIVQFRAIIFNRRGQKLYEWSDLNGGWDGKYNGHDVREGVYYVYVHAKGADGREYNIRKDVNLLRNYTDTQGGGTTTP